MKISQIYSGHTETNEKHPIDELKTRYYKSTKESMMKKITEFLHQSDTYEILDEDVDRGEFSVNVRAGKGFLVVITVIMVRPFRTAVDFSASTDWGFDFFGQGKKMILSLYEQIGKHVEYIGTGIGE